MNISRPALRLRLEHFLNVKHPIPDEARRGRLLNILLLGAGTACSVLLIALLIVLVFDPTVPRDQLGLFIVSSFCLLVMTIGLYGLNRRGHPRAAAILFVMGILLIVLASDTARNLLDGRSTVAMAIPIIIASAVIAPASSFALVVFEIVLALILIGPEGVTAFALITRTSEFFIVALVSWLSARGLEK